MVGSTVTVNDCAMLWGGTPLSVTTTVNEFVLAVKGAVQVRTPDIPPIDAPTGELVRLKTSVCGGLSVSIA